MSGLLSYQTPQLFPQLATPQGSAASSGQSVAQEQASRASALQATGFSYCEQGEFDNAVPCLESALSLWTVLGDLQAEQRLFKCLGYCYWQLGRFQTAQCCYQEAETLGQALSRSDRFGKFGKKASQIWAAILG